MITGWPYKAVSWQHRSIKDKISNKLWVSTKAAVPLAYIWHLTKSMLNARTRSHLSNISWLTLCSSMPETRNLDVCCPFNELKQPLTSEFQVLSWGPQDIHWNSVLFHILLVLLAVFNASETQLLSKTYLHFLFVCLCIHSQTKLCAFHMLVLANNANNNRRPNQRSGDSASDPSPVL